MWAGTAVTATGTIMTGFSSSFWTILSCRMMVGAGSSMSMTGSSAYLADLSDKGTLRMFLNVIFQNVCKLRNTEQKSWG